MIADAIVDMGLYFDGRCAKCGDWIAAEHEPLYTAGAFGHGVEHATCSMYTLPYEDLPEWTREVDRRKAAQRASTTARIYQIETLRGRCYDIEADSRAEALAIHERNHPDEIVIDSKDKTARRAHERARADQKGALMAESVYDENGLLDPEVLALRVGDVLGPIPRPKRGGYFICGPCNGRATKVIYLGRVRDTGTVLRGHSCEKCHARASRERARADQRLDGRAIMGEHTNRAGTAATAPPTTPGG